MSISPAIDRRYRLEPRDLGRQEQIVTIQNVTHQGLESLAPLLHFHEIPSKKLLLEPIQCQELAAITGTTHQAAWVGHRVLLAAQSDRDRLRIHLFSPTAPKASRTTARARPLLPANLQQSSLLLLLLILLLLAAFALNENSPFWQWIGL